MLGSCECRVRPLGPGHIETASVNEIVVMEAMRVVVAGVKFVHRGGIVSGALSSTVTRLDGLVCSGSASAAYSLTPSLNGSQRQNPRFSHPSQFPKQRLPANRDGMR